MQTDPSGRTSKESIASRWLCASLTAFRRMGILNVTGLAIHASMRFGPPQMTDPRARSVFVPVPQRIATSYFLIWSPIRFEDFAPDFEQTQQI
jgi:hypothetical protein